MQELTHLTRGQKEGALIYATASVVYSYSGNTAKQRIPHTKEHIYFVLRNENGIIFLSTESQSMASTFGMNLHLKIKQVHFDQTSHVFLLLLLELLPKCRIIIIFYQE